jgi:branched-chain amino acid transport system ATP-binding protein
MPVLEARNVTCRFGGFTALSDVSLGLEEGRVTGLIGPNGAGKSTLINVLSGAIKPTDGAVMFDGRDITGVPIERRRRAGLARSFQQTSVFPALTLRQQLAVAARAVADANVDEVAASLSLTPLLDVPAREVSYGDQRRLDLALALIGHPKVLLLDEPAAGLTVEESLSLAKILKDLASHWSITVLLVEHDMEMVFAVCERLFVLHLGKPLASGTPQDIRRNPDVIRAYLGSAAEETAL